MSIFPHFIFTLTLTLMVHMYFFIPVNWSEYTCYNAFFYVDITKTILVTIFFFSKNLSLIVCQIKLQNLKKSIIARKRLWKVETALNVLFWYVALLVKINLDYIVIRFHQDRTHRSYLNYTYNDTTCIYMFCSAVVSVKVLKTKGPGLISRLNLLIFFCYFVLTNESKLHFFN